VFCQLETLRLCFRSRVRHCLNELPDSLDETYERILKGIHKSNQTHVRRLLQCLAVAIRPLQVEDVGEILAFDPDATEGELEASTLTADSPRSEDRERELLSACPSLITIVNGHSSRVVQFSHFSVKEFLSSDRLAASPEHISRYHILPEAAHTVLAQASLGVLLRLDDSVDSSSARNTPLAEYAAKCWVSHAQFGNVSSHVMGQMETLFDSDRPHFEAWVRIHDIDRPPLLELHTKGVIRNHLYYAALCGLSDLSEHLVKKHPQSVNTFGGKHGYPLVAALHGGYIPIAELLFQFGANVDAQGTEEQPPLHTAIELPDKWAVGAVQCLLKHDANVNARRKDLWTPLHLAAARGKFELAQMLLRRKAGH
jgi:hypothetical protein